MISQMKQFVIKYYAVVLTDMDSVYMCVVRNKVIPIYYSDDDKQQITTVLMTITFYHAYNISHVFTQGKL